MLKQIVKSNFFNKTKVLIVNIFFKNLNIEKLKFSWWLSTVARLFFTHFITTCLLHKHIHQYTTFISHLFKICPGKTKYFHCSN